MYMLILLYFVGENIRLKVNVGQCRGAKVKIKFDENV